MHPTLANPADLGDGKTSTLDPRVLPLVADRVPELHWEQPGTDGSTMLVGHLDADRAPADEPIVITLCQDLRVYSVGGYMMDLDDEEIDGDSFAERLDNIRDMFERVVGWCEEEAASWADLTRRLKGRPAA